MLGSVIELGIVRTTPAASPIPGGALAARHAEVELVPGGRTVDCRIVNLGQGAGKGDFAPIAVGDEVLVLFPGGDVHAAVALGGLGSAAAPHPAEADGDHRLLMHPGGVELRDVTGTPAYRIVHVQLLQDLLPYFTAVEAFVAAVAAAAAVPGPLSPLAAAATAYYAAAGGPPASILAQLTAAVSAGPPYASALNKTT